jgi:hypothetical protein
LEAIEPVARCAFLVEDPDASFSLAAQLPGAVEHLRRRARALARD